MRFLAAIVQANSKGTKLRIAATPTSTAPRVEAVHQTLLRMNVAAGHLSVQGYGAEASCEPADTLLGRRANRRAMFTVAVALQGTSSAALSLLDGRPEGQH